MALTNKTYAPVLSITVRASQNLPAFRFAGFNGGLCSQGEKALGVTDAYCPSDENATVTVIGVVLVEAGGNISVGDDVTSGANGKALAGSSNDFINGDALDDGASGDLIRVLLK
jgi:hypothetical protein